MLQISESILLDDVKKEILEFCLEPQGKDAILDHINVENTSYNQNKFIKQLQDQRFITSDQTIVRSFNKQKFVTTQKGLNYLKAITL